MTLNELKKEVLALMFESEFDSHEAFVFAANRALTEIHGEKERLVAKKIHKKRLVPKEYYEKLTHESDEILSISLNGKAFSFTAVGSGEVLFQDGALRELISFSGASTDVKRRITTGNAILRFRGAFDYEIYNLASFAYLYGEKNEDVELYSSLTKYDMRKEDPLFLSFASVVKDGEGHAILGLKTEGSAIFVPSKYEGELNLSYRRMPRKIGVDELDTEIDISPECEHLLALRCAAYLLLDGNEGLAEYYLSLFRSGIGALKAFEGKATSEKFLDVLGWA